MVLLSFLGLLQAITSNASAFDPYGWWDGAVCHPETTLQDAINHTVDHIVYVNDIGTEFGETFITNDRALVAATDAAPCTPAVGIPNPVIHMAGTHRLISVTDATLVVDSVTLESGDSSGNGGNIQIINNNPFVERDLFLWGSAVVRGGHALGDGGGIYSEFAHIVVMPGASIEDNVASGNGGGLAVVGNSGNFVHSINNVEGNVAEEGDGGGVYAEDASMCLWRTQDNEATLGNGGGAYFTGVVDPLYWTLGPIVANHAAVDGGGTFLHGGSQYAQGSVSLNTADGNGGGLRATNGAVLHVQRSATIDFNEALANGGGIHADSAAGVVLPFLLGVEQGGDVEMFDQEDVLSHSWHAPPTVCDMTVYDQPTSVLSNSAGDTPLSVGKSGGGLYLSNATLDFDETIDDDLIELVVSDNFAKGRGGGVSLRAAAEFIANDPLNNVEVSSNSSSGQSPAALDGTSPGGGGIDVDGEGTLADIFLGVIDDNTTSAAGGGGVMASNGGAFVQASGSISGNIAKVGGGLFATGGIVQLGGSGACTTPAGYVTCLLIDGNTATSAVIGGGAIATYGSVASDVDVARALVTDNLSDNAPAVLLRGANDVHTYTNTVFTGNNSFTAAPTPFALQSNGTSGSLLCQQCTVARNEKGVEQLAGTVEIAQAIVNQNGTNLAGAVTNSCSAFNVVKLKVDVVGFPTAGLGNISNKCASGVRPDIIEEDLLGMYDMGAYEVN